MADTPTLPEDDETTPSGAQPDQAPGSGPAETPTAATTAEQPTASPSASAIPSIATDQPAGVDVTPAAEPAPAAQPIAGAQPTPGVDVTLAAEPASVARPVATTQPAPGLDVTPTAEPAAAAQPIATAQPTPDVDPAAAAAAAAAVQPGAAQPAQQTGTQAQAAAAAAAAETTARQAANEITARSRTWWNRLDPTTRRPTLILGAILLIAVLGSQFLNALIPTPAGAIPGGGGGGDSGTNTIQLGGGAQVTPPEGWTVVGPTPNLQGVELQKGSVIVDVMVAAYSGSPQDLLQTYVGRYLDVSASQLTVGDIAVGPGPNGHLTATAFYVGIFFEVGTLQGVVATQVWGNVGVIVDAAAPQGQLQGALGDIQTIIGTIEVR